MRDLTLLELAKAGEWTELDERLTGIVRRIHRTGTRERLTDDDRMLTEAHDFLKSDLRVDCLVHLERLVHPKWKSKDECQSAYLDAMAENTHARHR